MTGITIDNLFYKCHSGVWLKVDHFNIIPHCDDSYVIAEPVSKHYGGLRGILKVIKYDMELNLFGVVSRHDNFYITDLDLNELHCNDKPCPFCGGKTTVDAVTDIKRNPMPVSLCRGCGARGPSDGVLSWDDRL